MHASENCRFIDTEYGTSVSCIQFEHMATCPWSRAHGHMLMVTCSWSLTRRTRGQARHNPAIWEEQKTSECSHASIPLLALRALLSYPHSSPPPSSLPPFSFSKSSIALERRPASIQLKLEARASRSRTYSGVSAKQGSRTGSKA